MRTVDFRSDENHFLIRLDARLKMLATLLVLAMVLSSRGAMFPLLTAAVSVGCCLAVGVRLRLLLIRFAEPLAIAVMVLLLKIFCSGSQPLFAIDIFGLALVGHADGLREGALIASRMAGAVSIVAAVGFATPFTEVMGALAWMRLPKGLIEVMVFAWRYLFLLYDDAQVIHAAQRNRLGYSGLRQGVRSFGTLAGALVIKAFDSSQAMTTAMVQRGYDGTLPMFCHKPFRGGELLGAMSVVLLFGLVWKL